MLKIKLADKAELEDKDKRRSYIESLHQLISYKSGSTYYPMDKEVLIAVITEYRGENGAPIGNSELIIDSIMAFAGILDEDTSL